MKGYHFYLEHETPADKRKGKHNGNVFAAYVEQERGHSGKLEGLGAVFYWPNSPVCVASAHPDYLRRHCKRISEAKAREIHPALFAELDRER